MGRQLHEHLNQAAFLSGVAAAGLVQTGVHLASRAKTHRPHTKKGQAGVVLGEVKYRPEQVEPANVLRGIKTDLDDIKDALVDIAEKR
ncbi:MAG TPA: hypothetical protein H9869_03970 [Candidatus Ligilactobacillus excrementipullorum]|nr:hypothetical protein [Candidatus Ligilactobacillus excrementipullorum]